MCIRNFKPASNFASVRLYFQDHSALCLHEFELKKITERHEHEYLILLSSAVSYKRIEHVF